MLQPRRSDALPLQISREKLESPRDGGHSSMVEPQIVVLAVAGSSPVGHPIPDASMFSRRSGSERALAHRLLKAGHDVELQFFRRKQRAGVSLFLGAFRAERGTARVRSVGKIT